MATFCHQVVYSGVMPKEASEAARSPRSGKNWQLTAVRPRPEGAAHEVVGIFIAQHESGWQVTGELARQEGRLIVRSFTVQPVRLALQKAMESIAASRKGAPGSVVVTEYMDDVIEAKSPRGGVTAQLLRSIPFGSLLADVLVRMDLWETAFGGLLDDDSEPEDWEIGRRAMRQVQEIRSLQHKVGRPSYSDDFYRQVAKECLAIQAERPDRGVTRTLADRRATAYETARGWIKEARHREMIAPGSPGRSGFEAGVKLYQDGRSGDGT